MRSEMTLTTPGNLDFHILVVCQNEAARIRGCLASIRQAIGTQPALVTLNLNGSSDGSEAAAVAAAADCGLPLQLYRIRAADKANALNRFIYTQRVPARTYVFVDGYTRITPGSLACLDAALARHPHAMASTGVCLNGRTMRLATRRTLEEGGVLHGQLHALRPDFLDRMVARGIRLPIGMYWGDGLMGSMAAHNLDAMGAPWDNRRIVGVAEAGYEIPQLSVWSPGDIRRQLRRKSRQMRGKLQNLALRDVIYRLGYEGLPANADDMVRNYLARHGVPVVPLINRPFMAHALRELGQAAAPDPASLEPVRSLAATAA